MTKAEERKAKRAESTRKPTKKKPKDKPKRPRSAYNYFFQQERQKILAYLARDKSAPPPAGLEEVVDAEQEKRLIKETGKVSFEEMGKIIGTRWKSLPNGSLSKFTELALGDTERYKKEMVVYNKKQDDAATQAMKAQTDSAGRPLPGTAAGMPGGPMAGPYGGAQGNLYASPYGVPGMAYPGGNMAFPGMQMGGYPNPSYPGYGYPYQQYYGGAGGGGAYPQGSPGGPSPAPNPNPQTNPSPNQTSSQLPPQNP